MVKRVRAADTAAGAAQAFIDAAKGLAEPPAHVQLLDKDTPYWQAIVSLRAKDEWTEVMLVAAAQLARTQADIEEWTRQLRTESPIILTGPHDTEKVNPLITAIETATRRQLALMRSLGLVSMEDRDAAKKRQQTLKSARQASAKLAGQALLA